MRIEFRYCSALDLAWCRRMRRQWAGFGAYIGEFGCYRPDDDTICLGIEMFSGFWLNKEMNGDKLVQTLIGTLNHEAIHRAIYQVTGSKRACLYFDLLFSPFFNYKANREWFDI